MSDKGSFFVITDNANSHFALKFWLQKREFNQYESGKKDKRGNPIIKLINRVDDSTFSKEGIICCLNESFDTAEKVIKKHLKNEDEK